MNRATTVGILSLAALLEAGGDALVRTGLRTSSTLPRLCIFVAGAAVLFAYGLVVNAPAWNFGRLLGVYVALFFVIAQTISWIAFGEIPSRPILLGGALIVAGGMVVAFG